MSSAQYMEGHLDVAGLRLSAQYTEWHLDVAGLRFATSVPQQLRVCDNILTRIEVTATTGTAFLVSIGVQFIRSQ